MTLRQKGAPHGAHLDTLVCEKYMSKMTNREKQLSQLLTAATARGREKSKALEKPIKTRPNVRQQNPAPGKPSSKYADDLAISAEAPTKTTTHRSKSATKKDETWSGLLQQYNGEKNYVFSNFDPLRTLHFVAKELQLQLQYILPDDVKIQQMIADMRYALKRVPPEVASQVHLKGIDNKKEVETLDRGIQGPKYVDETENLQRIMAEGTLKLESSCKQMEKLCTDLKNEKIQLEKDLHDEKEQHSKLKKKLMELQKKIEDLELENTRILNPRINTLEEEKNTLQSQIQTLYQTNTHSEFLINDLRSQLTEVRSQKNGMEQENNKLKHQLKLGALEREKFVAVLTLRDTQINEIRSEMGQLQEMVNEQLMELHTNTVQSLGVADKLQGNSNRPHSKDHIIRANKHDDNTLSTISSQETFTTPNIDHSFKELQAGEIDISNLPDIDNIETKMIPTQDRPASHMSLKSMFDEIKQTAFTVVGSQRDNK